MGFDGVDLCKRTRSAAGFSSIAGGRLSWIGYEQAWWASMQREIAAKAECKASVQWTKVRRGVQSSGSGSATHGVGRWLMERESTMSSIDCRRRSNAEDGGGCENID